MKDIILYAKLLIGYCGMIIGTFIGTTDVLLYTLIGFVAADYCSGVMNAIVAKNLNSHVAFKGLFRKVLIFLMVGIGNMLDRSLLGGTPTFRTAVIGFYITNEGLSLLENAAKLGLPVPKKIKDVLEQLKEDSADGGTKS